MKKKGMSFSALSIKKKEKNLTKKTTNNKNTTKKTSSINTSKKRNKSSTYRYEKRRYKNRSKTKKNIDSSRIPAPEKDVVRIIPLGGVEEIGKNMTAIEINDDIIVVDAGMYFSTKETPGIDYVIPNTTYLEERKDKIRALIITHGHLDHIGGVPLVLDRIGNPPVYSRNLSILMMRKRQAEYPHLPKMKENIVEKNDVIKCGDIKIRFWGVTHTIPDSMGVIVETKNGIIVTPGDYKLDQIDGVVTPEEEEEYKIFDNEKVLLLMTDSTNIENEGFALPEIKVHQGLESMMKKTQGRLIIAAFASHITRLAFIVRTAEKLGKKVAIDGRSMKTNMEVAEEANYFKPKKGTIIPIDQVDDYPPHKVLVLMTGAQGEEFAALNRAANKTHHKFSLKKGDTIILSSSVIPGNGRQIQVMKDGLARQGVHIVTYKTPGEDHVHATGHGNQEDIKWLHRKLKEKFFIPIHGYHYFLQQHKDLAVKIGIPEENIIVPDNGSIIEISADGNKITKRKEKAPSNPMMVDGSSVSDMKDIVIKDRKMLSEDGMFVIIAVINQKTGKLKKSPDLISRGFVYLKENQDLLRKARMIIKKTTEDIIKNNKQDSIDLDEIKAALGESISKFLYQKTAKRPLVIPVVLIV